jgi:hypothetical protein
MARGTSIVIGAICALLALAATAIAAPPPNDHFSAAQPLSPGQEIAGSNLEATAQASEPEFAGDQSASCVDPASQPDCAASVWYSFEAPGDGEYTVETCDAGTDVDTVLGVFSGSTIQGLTPEGVDGDAPGCEGGWGGEGSRVSFSATAGTVYHVDLGGREADEGSFYVRAYRGGPRNRPEPDTAIERAGSYSFASRTLNGGVGTLSGSRYSASFALRSTQPGSGFECSLDGGGFSPCESVVSFNLAPGSSHDFVARATIAGQTDPTPAIERFAIASAPPETFLTGGPSGSIPVQEALWETASSLRANIAEPFLCGLDGEPDDGCERATLFTELCAGTHVFRAAAFDKSSLVDPTPVSAAVTPTAGPACTPPAIEPPSQQEPGVARAAEAVGFDAGGMGGRIHVDYGETASYGLSLPDEGVEPGEAADTYEFELPFLRPATLYHFRVTLTTPLGSVSTRDATLTTKAAGGVLLPGISNGEPTVAGDHAASLPFTIETKGEAVRYRLYIEAGAPATPASPMLSLHEDEIGAGLNAAQLRTIPVTDLDPSTTYHYRLAASTPGPESGQVLGPEGTFTTGPKIATTLRQHFKLRRGNVKVGRLARNSKRLRVRFVRVPAKTKLKLKLKVGGRKQTATRKANPRGRAKLKVTLSKRIRKALRNHRVRKAILRITAAPPDDTRSRVTIKKKLKTKKRRRHRRGHR